ncbi:MAG: Putative Holliday junction resolvase YggF [uncultured Campylobacterales bacterium]|uniref:Putative pre-16S rRNA nuclease n=1 Tax=uncultured Campylobacterales bacterium TaxID=352960 RepID=A0A6S6SD08_9BACT|nr:MAG: Putative Holliday junction resolvase YggF [uncultured Campylobacterales bacterium]
MEKLACIDVGLKRIGLAFCFDNSLVLPQNPVLRRNRNQAANDVLSILKEWNIDKLIIGLPTNSPDTENRINHFTGLLDFKSVEFQDEDFSSRDAKELAKGVFRNTRDGKIDSLSAKVILENYIYRKNNE